MRDHRQSSWAKSLGRTFALTALVASLALPAAASDVRITVEYIPDAEFDFGRGFDATASEVRASCVEYAKLNEVGSTSAPQVNSGLEMISDSKSLDKALGVSAAAKFSYGIFSASASTSYSQDHSINSFSQTYVARSTVTGATRSVDSPRLKAEYAEKGKDLSYFPRFRSVCGDYYVDGFTTGGEYFGIVTISTLSREDKESVDVGINAAFDALTTSGEVTADVRSSVSSLSANHRLKVTEIRKGGAGEPIAINATTMLENYRNFARAVEERPAFYHVILRKYSDLPNYPFASTDPAFEAAIAAIKTLADLSHEWTSVLNDINELINHKDDYIGAAALPLEDWQGDVTNTLAALRKAFLDCAADYTNCKIPTLDHTLRYYTDNYPRSTWTRIPHDSNLAAQDIAVGSKDVGWALFSSTNPPNPEGGYAPKRLGSGNTWTDETGGLVRLAIGADGTVFGVNNADVAFRWGGSGWSGLDAKLKGIAAGSANRVWGVNAAGEVFARGGSGWSKIDVGRLVAQVAIGTDGTLAIRSRDNEVLIGPNLSDMKVLAGDRQIVDVSVGSRNHVYIIDDAADLYRWNVDTQKLIGPMGKFTRVSAASDGTVWAMDGQGDIFKLGSL